jgi:tRNA A-37 threonylcarbamoyl transferase component Bud32
MQALDRSSRHQDEYGQTLKYLGLHLCEPLFAPFVGMALGFILAMLFMIFAASGAYWSWGYTPLIMTFTPLALMAFLLLKPRRGLHFQNQTYRKINEELLRMGKARLLLPASIAGYMLLVQSINPDGITGLLLVIGLLGIVFLALRWLGLVWYAARWGTDLMQQGALALPPPRPRPQRAPAPAAPQPQAQAARTAAEPQVRPMTAPPPVDSSLAILCPVCHTPTSRHAQDCHSCGLVFRSRIPAALQNLERYRVLRPLGSGGMSSVYLAHDTMNSQLCVLKTLASVDHAMLHDPELRSEAARCLRQEAALLQQLAHPNIARLRDYVNSPQSDFLVLEYIPGLTLEQRLTRTNGQGGRLHGEPLPLAEALLRGVTVVSVLDYLARLPQPVVHHDIKPANLILHASDQRLVVVDFGGAVTMASRSSKAAQHDSYGTPGYAAPEMYQGQATPQSDIYGLAATLYHLLTDDDPTYHPLDFPQLAELPPELAELLRSALHHDPAARPDARMFQAALARQLAQARKRRST